MHSPDIKKKNHQNEAKLKYELRAVTKFKLITACVTVAV